MNEEIEEFVESTASPSPSSSMEKRTDSTNKVDASGNVQGPKTTSVETKPPAMRCHGEIQHFYEGRGGEKSMICKASKSDLSKMYDRLEAGEKSIFQRLSSQRDEASFSSQNGANASHSVLPKGVGGPVENPRCCPSIRKWLADPLSRSWLVASMYDSEWHVRECIDFIAKDDKAQQAKLKEIGFYILDDDVGAFSTQSGLLWLGITGSSSGSRGIVVLSFRSRGSNVVHSSSSSSIGSSVVRFGSSSSNNVVRVASSGVSSCFKNITSIHNNVIADTADVVYYYILNL